MSKEQFVDLEKTKVEILKEKAEIGISEFKEDSSKNWVEIRFEKPLLVKMLSLIEQAERVQELEGDKKALGDLIEKTAKKAWDIEQQNKRYRDFIKQAYDPWEITRKIVKGTDREGATADEIVSWIEVEAEKLLEGEE